MDECLPNSLGSESWKTTMASFLINMKSEFEAAKNQSVLCHQPVPKKLTTEALIMIFVILVFVILTLIRSLAGLFENYQLFVKVKHSSILKRKEKVKDTTTYLEREGFLPNLQKFLDCFCMKSNAKRIVNTGSSDRQLSCIHGIKAIVLIAVLFGHLCLFYCAALKTRNVLVPFMELQATQILKNNFFIVDTFLVLSGFLNGYLFSQRYEEKKGKISWLSFYVHRFVRITPMYFLVLGFYATLFPYLGSGPVWPTYTTNPVCRENWMWHVSYINNFNSHLKQCLISTWYLPCEMQLFIISPIFLIPVMRRPKIGYALMIFGICGSCLINFLFTIHYNLLDGVGRFDEYFSTDLNLFYTRFWEYYDVLYSKPYSRIGNFLTGLALGCYLSRKKAGKFEESNQMKHSLGWFMSAIFMWISMFALIGREESTFETAIYNGVKHLLFSISLSWIIFVCVTEQEGFINKFLSSKIFIVISRLSYSTYLFHLIIIEWYFLSKEDLIDHSIFSMIFHFQLMFWMLAGSFVVSLVFEAPIIRITSLFFKETHQETKASKQE